MKRRRSKTQENKKIASFVATFSLCATAADERVLRIRFDAARHIYNASLGESLKRLATMRESEVWQRARAMKKSDPERIPLFRSAKEQFDYSQYSIQKYAESCRDACWIGDHLGSHDTQTISLRAFRAVEEYSMGKRGRPRFKGRNRINSVEGKGDAVIRHRRDEDGAHAVHWSGLFLPLILNPRDHDEWQSQALNCRTKYVRILRKTVKGKILWYGQLVLEGHPPRKNWQKTVTGVVGLDMGPSTIAAVGEVDAVLENFCPTIEERSNEIRRIQRAMDRSRRATNPHAFREDGSYIKGARITGRSSRYKKLSQVKREVERCLADERKRSHGELANRVLGQGNFINLEKLSYRGFQKSVTAVRNDMGKAPRLRRQWRDAHYRVRDRSQSPAPSVPLL